MKNYEIITNEHITDTLNKELRFVAVTTDKESEMEVQPANGAKVLIHDWVNEVVDGQEGYDTWEVVRWFKADTRVDTGDVMKAPEEKVVLVKDKTTGKGKKKTTETVERKVTAADRIMDVLMNSVKTTQVIEEDGFYWQDDTDDMTKQRLYHKIALSNIDCWCELKGTDKGVVACRYKELIRHETGEAAVKKNKLEVKEEMKGSPEKKEGINTKTELLFAQRYKLCGGNTVIIRTIPEKDWKDGSALPDDVGAFEWAIYDEEGEMLKSGKFSGRFSKGKNAHWDIEEIGKTVIEYILEKTYGVKGDYVEGLYELDSTRILNEE